jgi:DNA-binding XRE family transcriptional regulator
MPRSRKSQRAKGRANREEILNLKRNDGVGVKDPTPFVAVLNLIMRGKYLRVARGFPIKSTIKEINKIEEVQLSRLREARKAKGLSQLKLAFMTGIAPSEISRIENGWIKPYPSWKKRLSRALGVPESELFPPEEKSGSDAD